MIKPLAPIRVTERYSRPDAEGHSRGSEVWAAVTLDGAGTIERTEDPGTPWMLTRTCDNQSAGQVGTLKRAQEIIASGLAEIRANVRKAGQEAYDAAVTLGFPVHERDAARLRAENDAVARFMQERQS